MTDVPRFDDDKRRPAARRTALIVALVALAIYAAFFLRAVLNGGAAT
jgi:hypothetical protein